MCNGSSSSSTVTTTTTVTFFYNNFDLTAAPADFAALLLGALIRNDWRKLLHCYLVHSYASTGVTSALLFGALQIFSWCTTCTTTWCTHAHRLGATSPLDLGHYWHHTWCTHAHRLGATSPLDLGHYRHHNWCTRAHQPARHRSLTWCTTTLLLVHNCTTAWCTSTHRPVYMLLVHY